VYVANELGIPVAGANLTLSCTNGTLSDYTGTTDSNGLATFILTAPVTLSEINITVTATASIPQYPTGQGEVIVTVEPRELALEVTSSPNVILSEEATSITAVVTFDANPVANATVTVTSDVGGNFSSATQLTDATGVATFAFTAPQTTATNGINATITATAAISGYLNAESQTIVTIMPKVLSVSVTPSSPITYSYGTSNVTVHVGYGSTPIQGANVTITATNGTFAQTTGSTDDFGNVTFAFTAPTVNAATNITLLATASGSGYLDNNATVTVQVNPRTFSFQTAPVTLWAGQTQTVSIHVTCKEDSTSVAGATVTLSYAHGGPLTNITDSIGTCTFIVNVPQAPTGTLNFTVTLARSGYQTIQSNVILNVVTQQQGFPWLTVILIAIAIVAVVVVIVLIKMKVIVLSTSEETEAL
jgi:phosphatidate phosphatase APP1